MWNEGFGRTSDATFVGKTLNTVNNMSVKDKTVSESQIQTIEDPPMTRHCAFCLAEIPPNEVLRCGGCHRRVYCDKDCQRSDWSVGSSSWEARGQGHKHWCGLEVGEEDLDWKVAPVGEGKGLGLIALRTLSKGSRILVDACQSTGWAHPGAMDLLPLNGSLKEKFSLNCLGAHSKEGEHIQIICLRIARVNHSCNANASHVYDNHFKVKILFSERDIAVGEEICISYASLIPQMYFSDPNDPLYHPDLCPDSVRAGFKRKWGILCPEDCLCRDPEAISNVKRVMELAMKIPILAQKGQIGLAVREVKALLELHHTLHSPWLVKKRALEDGLAFAVSSQETLEEGKMFTQELVQGCASIMHPKNPDLVEMTKWKDDLSTHPNYLRFDQGEGCDTVSTN